MADPIYLRSQDGYVTQACDEDTRYWIFDDSPEPVGLTCELKATSGYERITKEEWDVERANQQAAMQEVPDTLVAYLDYVLLERALQPSTLARFLKP